MSKHLWEVDHPYYDGGGADDRDDSCVPRDMDRSGPITTAFDTDGFVEWRFA